MNNHQLQFLAISIFFVAILIQLAAVFLTFRIVLKTNIDSRRAWIFLGVSSCFMLGIKLSSIEIIYGTGHYNLIDGLFAILIAFFYLIGIIGINKVLSKSIIDRDKLTKLYQHDPLTQSLSRSEILARLANEIKRAIRSRQPISVLVIDIDHFKKVNDQYGHEVGDEILCALVNKVQSQLRSYDHLGRIGGEEFVLVLPEANELLAKNIAERIRLEVEKHSHFTKSEADPIKITISIGVSSLPLETSIENLEETKSRVLKQADQAMYAAKNSGRNKVVVWSACSNQSQQSFGR